MSTEAIIVLHQVRVDLTTLFLHIHMANKKEPLIIKPRLDQLYMYILAIHKISVTTKKLKAMNNYACVLILVIAHSYDLS